MDERWLNSTVCLPMSRIVDTANVIGSQETTSCPPTEGECWLKRNEQPYLGSISAEYECVECWLAYLLRGE